MPAWMLWTVGCIWVPGSELDVRWAELVDADKDGHDDVAYGGDDCDDGDPEVHPGAVEWLGDDLDSDCDGEADGSPWTSVDLRGSQGFQGPRLALGEERILLAWQAETLEGDTTLHDGFGVIGLSEDDPAGPELGVWLEGEAEDLVTSGPFDMDAVAGTVLLGLSSWTEQERLIGVHGLPDDLSTHHAVHTEPFAGPAFARLQLAASASDATILMACGQEGAGIHGVALWGHELTEGSTELIIDAPITEDGHDHGVCEVDPYYLVGHANNPPHDNAYQVYRFDQSAGTFSFDYTEMGVHAWVDFEICDEHDHSLQMRIDEQTSRVLVLTIADTHNRVYHETWAVLPSRTLDADTAPSTAGEAYACVVDEGGGVTLYGSDLMEQGNRAPIEVFTPGQDELGELLECALVVTEEDLLVLAVRGEDGIWLNRFFLPPLND